MGYERKDFVKCTRCGCPRIVHIEHKGKCVHCMSVGEYCENFTIDTNKKEIIIAFTNHKLELYTFSIWTSGLLMGVGFMSMISIGGWTSYVSFFGGSTITIYLLHIMQHLYDIDGEIL